MTLEAFTAAYPKQATQSIILQGYASEIMEEGELNFFYSLKTTDGDPVFISNKGLYQVTPAVSLDDFTNEFTPTDKLFPTVEGASLVISNDFEELITIPTKTEEEAVGMSEDLEYLFGEKWH
jgi:hypothetical protein